ncbi:MAG TPA: shikimate kinase [Candidatus Dormibacteraeota bacterium]|nr:shikimate kinase [Candidatus Dormibacteraeota bacterium]
MGSGKSVVGALVAYRAGAPFFDLDFMIESEAGMTIPEIFSNRGEEAFRALESRLLPSALRDGAVVALGGGTAMDDANWQLIAERSTSVYLELPFHTIWERIGRSENRPLVAGRLRKEVESLFDRRRRRYEQATHTVDADRSPDDVATDVLALWSD